MSSRSASSAAASAGRSHSQTAAASSAAWYAAEPVAPPELGLDAGQRRPQQPAGQQHLPFPDVAEAGQQLAPAPDVVGTAAGGAARRLLQAQPRQRRLAFEQRAVGVAVGMHLQQERVGQRDRLAPRRVQFDEAVGVVGEHRGAGEDQRAFAAQRGVDPGLGQDARDVTLGFVVSLAGRQRPGRRQQQARTPVELVGRQLPEPFEHRSVPAVLHQRPIQAAFGQPVGFLVPARRQRMTRGVVEEAVVGQPLRRAGMRPHLLRGAERAEALAQHVARERVHAQPFAPFGGGEHRGLAAQPREPRAGVVGIGDDAAQVRVQVVEDRDAHQQLAIRRLQVGQQQLHEPVLQFAARARPCRPRRRWRRRCATTIVSTSCSPSGQPSVSACRRAAVSRSTRAPKRPCTSCSVSSRLKRSIAGPISMHWP